MTYAEAEKLGIQISDEEENSYSSEDAQNSGIDLDVDEDEYNKLVEQYKEEDRKKAFDEAKKLSRSILRDNTPPKRDGKAPTVENARKEAKESLERVNTQYTQPEDTTSTRPFTQEYDPAVMDGMVSDGTISPQQQDKKAMQSYTGDGSDYENPTNDKYTDPIGEGRDTIIDGATKGLYRIMGSTAYAITNPFSHETASDIYDWFTKSGENISEKTRGFLNGNEPENKPKNKHTPEEVKKAIRKAGIFDIDTLQEVFNFIGTTGEGSVADMFAMGNPATLPIYAISRYENSAGERARKDGRTKATNEDFLKVIPTETASIMLDVYGLHTTTTKAYDAIANSVNKDGVKGAIREIKKQMQHGTVVEGLTEGVQNPIELYGKEYNTKHGFSDIGTYGGEAGFGALAGAGMGGALSGTSATIAEVQKPSVERVLADAIEQGVDNTDINTEYRPFAGENRENLKPYAPSKETIERVRASLPQHATDEEVVEIAQKVEEKLQDEPISTENTQKVDKDYVEDTQNGETVVGQSKDNEGEVSVNEDELPSMEKKKSTKRKAPQHIQEQLLYNEKAYADSEDALKEANAKIFKPVKSEERKYKKYTKDDIAEVEKNHYEQKASEYGDLEFQRAYEMLDVNKKKVGGKQKALTGLESGQQELFDTTQTEVTEVPKWAKKLVSDTTTYDDIVKAVTDAKNGVHTELSNRVMEELHKQGSPHLKKDIARYDDLSGRFWSGELNELEEEELDSLSYSLGKYLDEDGSYDSNTEKTPEVTQDVLEVQGASKQGNTESQSKRDGEKDENQVNDRFGVGFMGGADHTIWDRHNYKNGDYVIVGTVHNGEVHLNEEYKDNKEAIEFANSLVDIKRKKSEKAQEVNKNDVENTQEVDNNDIITSEHGKHIEHSEEIAKFIKENAGKSFIDTNFQSSKNYSKVTIAPIEKQNQKDMVVVMGSDDGNHLHGSNSIHGYFTADRLHFLKEIGKDENADIQRDSGDGNSKLGGSEAQSEDEQRGNTSEVRAGENNTNDDGVKEPTSKETDTATDKRSDGDSDTASHSRDVETEAPFVLSGEETAKSGEVTRYEANIEAIKLLKQNKKNYTYEEKQVLSRYTGWGGIQKAFQRPNGEYHKGWEERAKHLKEILTEDEYANAQRGILDAFYTPHQIISTMWDINEHLGFTGGSVLEPSVGTGRFIGMLPNNLRKKTSFDAVELDRTTEKIAEILYPNANISNRGFQETNYKGTHTLVVGNPPYGEFKIYDANNKQYSKLSAHNYFVVKSLDALQSGGVLNFVISSSFLDNLNATTKKLINEKAKLIGAIRLPDSAFSGAGTKVTTDIVVFQKLQDGEQGNIEEWGEIGNLNGLKINNYFVNNPQMLLGSWEKGYRGAGTLVAGSEDINALLNKAIESFPKDIITASQKISKVTADTTDVSVPPSILYVKDGKAYVNIAGANGSIQQEIGKVKIEKVHKIIALRDTTLKLLDMQLDPNVSSKEVESVRKKLNDLYDDFHKNYGYLNKTTNKSLITKDKNGFTLLGLEEDYKPTITEATAKKRGLKPQKESAKKADILKKRTASPKTRKKTDNPKEALQFSLNDRGYVDMDYMQDLLGIDEKAIEKKLGDEIFYDTNDGWVTKDVYLSGDVKTKYEQTNIEKNREALLKVIPEDKKATDIVPEIGQSWIDAKYLNQYASEVLGYKNIDIHKTDVSSKWYIGDDSYSWDFPFAMNDYDNNKILLSALNGKRIVIKKSVDIGGGEKRSYVDEGATDLANAKVEELKADFEQWIFKDADRRKELVATYNEKFNRYADAKNTDAVEEYEIPNVVKFKPRFHQKRAVYRAVFGTSPLLLNHAVGSGKTLTSQMIAMEWKRTGKANKPLIATLKATVPQYAKEFKQAYPNAKILVPTESDFSKDKRKALLSAIATGDYDAIIISHEQLGKLENPQEFEKQLIKGEIDNAVQAKEELKAEKGDQSSLRDMLKTIEKLEAKFEALQEKERDDILSFDRLGIDGLIIDESHFFKKLSYTSSLGTVKGMPEQKGSQKAFDLYVKTQSLLAKGNNNIVFMTGTPITNTIPELFLLQRFLQNDLLEEQGLNHFDAWAKNYVEQTTEVEIKPAGRFEEVTRIKNFKNLDSLMHTVGMFIDTATNEDIKKGDANFKLPQLKDGKPTTIFIEPSQEQLDYTQTLMDRVETTVKDKEDPDNYLVVFNDASKMAIDMRLIDDSMPDDPNSKINTTVDNVFEKYKEFDGDKGTQLIFSDIGTPKGGGKAKAKLEELVSKADNGDEKAQKEIAENYSDAEIEDILYGGEFSVYEDIRSKLIAKGIPAKEIAFIHDYNTKEQKNELSRKVNAGEVRIVLGSTRKLGTGVNVQERITAVHHIDIPYTPAELEQRNGRIIRQGNGLLKKYGDKFNIEISYYATKQTLDGVKWQILENKQKFIQQFMSGTYDSELDIEEESNTELMERMKAEASGNPLLLEKAKTQKELKKLRNMKRTFEIGKADAEQNMQAEEFFLQGADERIDAEKADLNEFENNEIKIGKKTFEKPNELGKEVVSIIKKYKEAKGLKPKVIGSVGNIDIELSYTYSTNKAKISFVGETTKSFEVEYSKLSDTGVATRMKNIEKKYSDEIASIEKGKPVAQRNIKRYKDILSKDFDKLDELEGAEQKLADIMEKIAQEAKEPQGEQVEDADKFTKKNKNTSVDTKLKRKKGFDGEEYSEVPLPDQDAMPNNPPLFRELNDIDDSELLQGYNINREKGTYELDGKRMQYPTPKKPIGVKYIRGKLEDILGYSPYRARIQDKDVYGLYKDSNGEVRTRYYGDLEVLAHEFGHFIHRRYLNDSFVNSFADELKEFAYDTELKEKKLISEGYAEFMRAYFTNSSWAKKHAPKFYEAFEKQLQSNDSELYKKVKDIQRYMHHYYAQGFDARTNSQMAIYPYSETFKERVLNKLDWATEFTWDNFALEIFDRTHGFWVAENLMNNNGGMYIKQASPTALLRTALGGATSTYEQILTHGIPEKKGDGWEFKKGAKSLQDVFAEAMATDTMKEWTEYALMLNARQLREQGKKSGFNSGDIDKKIEMLESKYPHFKKTFEDYQEFNNNMLDWYVEMSHITSKMADNFREANPIYLPTHRVLESMELSKQGASSKTFKRKSKTGSDLIYRDIVENIVAQLHAHVQGAMIDNAKSVMFNEIWDSENGAKIASRISKQAYYNKVPAGEQAKNFLMFLNENNMDIEVQYEDVENEKGEVETKIVGYDIVPLEQSNMEEAEEDRADKEMAIIEALEQNPEMMSYFTFGNPPKKIADSRVVKVIINDKEEYFEIAHSKEGDLLAKTLDNLAGHQIQGILGVIYKASTGWKNMFTKLITSNPIFKFGNTKRDYQETLAWRDERKGSNPLVPHNPIKGAMSFLNEDEFYHLYMLNGGGYGSFVEANTDHDYKGILLNSFGERFFRRYSVDEYANRFTVSMEAKDYGLSWQQVVNYGRDITLDFSMRGASDVVQVITNLSPFLRAGLNGTYKMIREMQREGRSKRAIAFTTYKILKKGGLYLFAMSALAFYLGYDDDRYKKLTADEKARNLYFFYSDDAEPIIIEIPHAIGFITEKIPEYIADLVVGTDLPKGTLRRSVLFAMKNQVIPLPDGGIAEPFIELSFNRRWTGEKVVPDYLQDVKDEHQFNAYTREIYKKVGDEMGMSPMQIEYLAKSLFTYPEKILGDLSDIVLWNEKENGVPIKSYGDVLLETLDKNIYRGGYGTSRSSYNEAYRERMEDVKKAIGSFRYLKRLAGYGEQERFKKYVKSIDEASFALDKIDKGLREEVKGYREKLFRIKRSKKYKTSEER